MFSCGCSWVYLCVSAPGMKAEYSVSPISVMLPATGSLCQVSGWKLQNPQFEEVIHFHIICEDEQYFYFNTLRPRRNEQHFADDIFKRIFFNENVRISIKISLKFVPKGPINIIPALVQIMAWRRSGDKPLSEPMMVSLPTHICVIRPQWVNRGKLYMSLSSYHIRDNINLLRIRLSQSWSPEILTHTSWEWHSEQYSYAI